MRIFVAATPMETLPLRVLAFSISETTTLRVELAPIHRFGRVIPMPKAVANRPRTPFSFQRFLIPELCGFAGRAIYLDADMLVFRDMVELWRQDFAGCDLQTVNAAGQRRQGQFSVMLLDCTRLCWNIDDIVAALDAGTLDYTGLMHDMRVADRIGSDIAPEWNSLERYDPAATRLLHYTDMNTQPWIATQNPLASLWIACLRRALAAGCIERAEIAAEIAAGHVRPSLDAQLDTDIDDTLALPAAIRKLDRGFVAPYRRLRSGAGQPWKEKNHALLAFLQRTYYRTPLARLFR